jgi:catechol 2,3-dioxygenase
MPLPPELSLGFVHLMVSDLDRSLAYYQNSLGFKLHSQDTAARTAFLGAGKAPLLALTEQPGAKHYRSHTGLYHFAILVPSRLELAHVLKHLANTQTPIDGFSDHLVSEAIYLSDPDHNGIEIYRDRPRKEWFDAQGNFVMGSEPLDLENILHELDGQDPTWHGLHPDTVLGHMHLHIRNIAEGQQFYTGLIGLDLMASWNSALFMSAGGYHHHLGANTWAGVGVPPPPPDATGLKYFTVHLPNTVELGKVVDRVRGAGVGVEEHEQGMLVRDPSKNGLVFKVG